MIEVETGRLLLRDWRDGDLRPWAEINADPEVRRYLGPVWTEQQAADSIARYQEEARSNGFGFWAVELRATGQLIGFAGLDLVEPEMSFTGVEIGWRLARSAWGHGYASEAARAALAYGFDTLDLAEIVAITLAGNLRSLAVMRRIGMRHAPELDFVHRETPESEPAPHTVYRIAR